MATAPTLDGDSQFSRGVNSNADPTQLTDGFSFLAFNLVNRGGLWQTRPGFKWFFNLPPGQRLQGFHLFRPLVGLEQLLAAVDGVVYISTYPFTEIRAMSGVSFRYDAEDVYFETADKSVNRNEDGSLTVVTPFRVVVMQDGSTPPAVWDGSNATTLTSSEETPIGTVMKWTGDRLWIARGRELFVGDINDPTGNVEQSYISNAKSFLLDRPILALAEAMISGTEAILLAFTDASCSAFRSSIRRRADWSDPEVEFQRVLFPNIGCVSHRSICTRNGLLHWFSQHGIMSFDSAMAAQQTSEIRYTDMEMAFWKGRISPDKARIAGASFENYLLMSVPVSDPFNSVTWVSDSAPLETRWNDSPESWNGVWTGIRPAEWAGGLVRGTPRLFSVSVDTDGRFRVWEAFTDEREDNGCPISWALESRAYTAGTLNDKEFRFADLFLSEISGVVDLRVQWAGASRGAFKDVMSVRLTAEEGIVYDTMPVTEDTQVFELKKQSRTVRTKNVRLAFPDKTSCQIESSTAERFDYGHQIRIYGSGQCAIRAIRSVMIEQELDKEVGCPGDEADEINMVRSDGRGSDTLAGLLDNPPIHFESTQTYTLSIGLEEYTGTGYAQSMISQRDADKIALCHARSDAEEWYRRTAPPFVPTYGSGSGSVSGSVIVEPPPLD
jgi:hypothetical protein